MSRTFTQIRTFSSDGTLIHDFFKVPKGKSAIVDMIVNVLYTYNSGSEPTGITTSVKLTKADGNSGTILHNKYDSSSSFLRLERCVLESEDMISINVKTNAGVRFDTSVYLGGVLQ